MGGDIAFADLLNCGAAMVRRHIREGRYAGHTAGLMPGKLQCNLAILPAADAADFLEFCRRNPKPCPLAGISQPGHAAIPRIGANIDIRSDASLYNIYRDGELTGQVRDLNDIWQDDFVTFAIGCSFSFEQALIRAGIAMRHIDWNVTVPMYRSSRPTERHGIFGGPMVVSMRPIPHNRIDEVRAISSQFPIAHGAPVHVGDPAALGIDPLAKPDWGSFTALNDGEVAAFWACGVTAQIAIRQARPAIAITHAPGAMLITDVDEQTAPIFATNDNHSPPPIAT